MFARLKAMFGRTMPMAQASHSVRPMSLLVDASLAAIRPQLKSLGMESAGTWGGRREYVMGYTVGFCRGLCDHRGLHESIGFDATVATWGVLTGQPEVEGKSAALEELVQQMKAQRAAFMRSMERGTNDAYLVEDSAGARGLVDAFAPAAADARTSAPAPAERSSKMHVAEPEATKTWEEALVPLAEMQLAWGKLDGSPKRWGKREATIIGYVSGFAQGACELMGKPEQEQFMATRGLHKLFKGTRTQEYLFLERERLLEADDRLFLQGARAGKKDFLVVTQRKSPMGLAGILCNAPDAEPL